MFKPVTSKIDFPKLEEEVLAYWKQHDIFEKSVTFRPEKKTWNFLDGPPFVTGLPHYGHLLTSIAKDLFPRYWTMKGYRVRRVWGWDGHGLPIENKVENQLQIKRKKDIEEKIGVGKFIELCKQYVNEVSDEWEWYIEHIARWVDFKHAYKTWNLDYMESVMWVFKQMYDKGYIYKGLRVSLYCPHCATPISNFEVAMDADNYKELSDHGTTYKYPLVDEKDTFVLAWSTTPWNKIVTPALAVNPKLTYVKIKQNDEYYILAKSTLKTVTDAAYKIVDEFEGSKLIGKKFIPHYDYYPVEKGKKAFEIVGGEFVTAEEGTGVVTIAAYGEEDLMVMQKDGIHIEMHLDEEGTIKPDVPLFGGMYYLKANKFVNEDLKKRGLIYKDEEISHNVPLCWRCHTRLYHAPQNAWYMNVQELKPQMKQTNEEVAWYPNHFKHGRFEKSLEAAPDWCISRNRYWGSPVPVWECECGERFVPGSLTELEEASGQKITDLHKPGIDEILVTCKKCGKSARRVPEVLDSWIEAGSAPFAERHFPFEKGEELSSFFPPDFIVEYTGQIRAWFYVLHVISNAIYKEKAFKNVLVNGVILGTDGRKMSKNYGNYPDPKELLQKYGADALRLYLMSSPVIRGGDILISEENYRNQVKGMMLILWNVYNFFITYANVDKWEKPEKNNRKSKNVLDAWIVSLLHRTAGNVTKELDDYNTITSIEYLHGFIDDFSKWYIRRSRDRVGPTAKDEEDKHAFYQTCFTVLTTFCKLFAPFAPFISESIYRNLTNEESVHLTDWPKVDEDEINDELIKSMQFARTIVERSHAARKDAGIKVRQPLLRIDITAETPDLPHELEDVIKDEINVKQLTIKKGEALEVQLDTTVTPDLKAEGEARDIIRSIQEERKKIGTTLDEKINVILPSWPKDFEEYIKAHALVLSLSKGDSFLVERLHEK